MAGGRKPGGLLWGPWQPERRHLFAVSHEQQIADDGRRIWPVDGYAREGQRVTDWLAKGVVKQHRRLGTTLNALIGAGFVIRHVDEWAPSAEQVAEQPALSDELDRPMMVLIAARGT